MKQRESANSESDSSEAHLPPKTSKDPPQTKGEVKTGKKGQEKSQASCKKKHCRKQTARQNNQDEGSYQKRQNRGVAVMKQENSSLLNISGSDSRGQRDGAQFSLSRQISQSERKQQEKFEQQRIQRVREQYSKQSVGLIPSHNPELYASKKGEQNFGCLMNQRGIISHKLDLQDCDKQEQVIPEEHQNIVLIMGLPEIITSNILRRKLKKFGNIIQTNLHKIEQVIVRFQNSEEAKLCYEQINAGFFGQHVYAQWVSEQYISVRRGLTFYPNTTSEGKLEKRDNLRQVCRHCHQEGHVTADCPELRTREKRKEENQSRSRSRSSEKWTRKRRGNGDKNAD